MVGNLESCVRAGRWADTSNALMQLLTRFAEARPGRWPGTVVSRLLQAAADAGVFEAVVAAMRSAPDVPRMQHQGCFLMQVMCTRSEINGDLGAGARRDRAAQAGAIEAAVEAMRLYPQEEGVQEWAGSVLYILACAAAENNKEAAVLRLRRFYPADTVALLQAARASFPQNRRLLVHEPYLLATLRAATAP